MDVNPLAPSNYPRTQYDPDRDNLRSVAQAQTNIIYCVLGQIDVFVIDGVGVGVATAMPVFSLAGLAITLGLLVLNLICISKLATALGESSLLYIILMFIPCISLIALLVISQKATTRLQQVGLLGANPDAI